MRITPLPETRMATIEPTSHGEAYDLSRGLGFIHGAITRARADMERPIFLTVNFTEIRHMVNKIERKADKEYEKGLLPNSENLRTVANHLAAVLRQHDPDIQ